MHRLLLLLVLFPLLLAACRNETPNPQVTPAVAPTAPAEVADSFPTPAATPEAAGATTESYLPLAPNGSAATAPPTAAVQTPTPTATPSYPVYSGPPLDPQRIGVQIHLHREDLEAIMNDLQALPVGWVKVQVAWKVHEPARGEYDAALFRELDQLVSRATSHDIQVLLSVAKAPDWARPTTEEDGPPADFAYFEAFMRALATRYQGNIGAYELWNEPNLAREWRGAELGGASFVDLLRAGAAGVRAADPDALVISGAPATTGINDGTTAIDDRVYLQQMIAAGAGEIVDGVGVHPYGWANPPASSVADPRPVAPSHNNHPSFFFGDTLRDYRSLLTGAGYPDLPLWVTEFGWGSFEDFGAAPPAGAEFMAHVSTWEQAAYTLDALRLGQEDSGVGPMFLWNLNFAPLLGTDFSEAGYSLLGLDGSPRPVYYALQSITRP